MLLRTIDESRPRVQLIVDGATVEAFEGETVAACLLRHDMAVTRLTPSGRKRGPYCLMGACSNASWRSTARPMCRPA